MVILFVWGWAGRTAASRVWTVGPSLVNPKAATGTRKHRNARVFMKPLQIATGLGGLTGSDSRSRTTKVWNPGG